MTAKPEFFYTTFITRPVKRYRVEGFAAVSYMGVDTELSSYDDYFEMKEALVDVDSAYTIEKVIETNVTAGTCRDITNSTLSEVEGDKLESMSDSQRTEYLHSDDWKYGR